MVTKTTHGGKSCHCCAETETVANQLQLQGDIDRYYWQACKGVPARVVCEGASVVSRVESNSFMAVLLSNVEMVLHVSQEKLQMLIPVIWWVWLGDRGACIARRA
jgi:hypothetical protein